MSTYTRLWMRKKLAEYPEYSSWLNMKSRCNNPNDKRFMHYGGRGIKVCERWRTSFDAFLADMGRRPTRKHQIDRIDNDGNYEPSNCQWVTITENNRNRSNNKLTIDDVRIIRSLFAKGKETGVSIARKFKISKTFALNIKNNIWWKDGQDEA